MTATAKGSVGLTKFSTDGTFILLSLNSGYSDRALSLVLTETEDFLGYEPMLFQDLKSLNGLLSYSKRFGKLYWKGELNYYGNASEYANLQIPSTFETTNINGRVSVLTKWAKILETTVGLSADQHRQISTIAGRTVDISLLTITPEVNVKLRGSAITYSTDASLLVRPDYTTVPVLDASITYRKPLRRWYLTLSGNDLLRYSGSSFSRLDVGTAVATEIDYARLRGFIALKASYTFSPKRASD